MKVLLGDPPEKKRDETCLQPKESTLMLVDQIISKLCPYWESLRPQQFDPTFGKFSLRMDPNHRLQRYIHYHIFAMSMLFLSTIMVFIIIDLLCSS